MNRKEQIALAIAVLIPFAIVVYSFDVGMWGIILALPIFVLILLILLINPMKRRDLSIGTVVGGVHLRKGWQVVNLSVGIGFWD